MLLGGKNIPWQIVTEREIPKTVFVNIQWLYSSEEYSEVSDGQVEQHKELFARELWRSPDQKIIATDLPPIISPSL
ncbi:TnsA endonuclease C-terminal domain-containing protein [Polycladidibacter stylochi]|uniref:TnsA endonuclease C-terminal domain-containing protein n=1 Tax=Polycladidibacter stylochi TaxID=1807766 RepID=UPI00187DAE13